jgi:Na+-translocating ferredoxin:NAD+ oxidoreductase RnfG subunit/NAD-dependent dihydropyrimidine dehydrogenase PreA subunit
MPEGAVMVSELIKGIWLGLASGSLCIGCWAVLLPMIVSSGKGRIKPSFSVFAQFTLGRLVTYVAFGALVGFVSSLAAGATWLSTAAAVAFIPLSGILLLQALRGGGAVLCRKVESFSAKSRLPFWVGMALGASVCPPFLIETANVVRLGSTTAGVVSFAGFFLGATIFMAPLVLFGLTGKAQFMRNLGRAACIFAALFFLYRGLGALVEVPQTTEVEVTEADLQSLLPEADRFTQRIEPGQGPAYREALDKKGNQIAVIYLSSDIKRSREIRGFGGHVPVLAAVKPDKLIGIKLLPGWETPSYVTRIYGDTYAAQFNDRLASDPFTPGKDIDAITGATVTNKAVCDEVRAILATTVGRMDAGQGGTVFPVSALILAAGFAAAAFAYLMRLRWLRYTLLAAGILYLGFYMKGLMFSSADVVKIMFFGKSLLDSSLTWFVLVGGILVTSLLFGRLFCGYLCPFGALHELCGRLGAKRFSFSGKLSRRLKYVKYVALFAAPALFLLTGRVSSAALEPFGTLFSLNGSTMQWVFVAFILAAGFFVMRFFCRFLCPAGAAMAILSLPRILRDRRRTNCVKCGKCIKACPADALSEAESILDADYTECLNCNDCRKVQKNAPCSKTTES